MYSADKFFNFFFLHKQCMHAVYIGYIGELQILAVLRSFDEILVPIHHACVFR